MTVQAVKTEAASFEQQNLANAAFWDELCGSQLARMLGITDHSPPMLRRFDDWYFAFYPYLADYVPFHAVAGKKVLEVGLGYGTVAQRLAASGALYQGLDVASGPVKMVNHRLASNKLPGQAVQGSVLDAPFEDASFDYVVAIGCFHHTGDVQRAVDESYRMLKPGGQLVFMVYYTYSYRRWQSAPLATLASLGRERYGWRWTPRQSERERAAYDANAEGGGAPITAFLSRGDVRRICARYSALDMALENASPEGIFRRFKRETLMRCGLSRRAGLDIYVRAVK